MLISTMTRVGFHLPDEYQQMIDFITNNDMTDWKKDEDTQMTYFTKTTHNVVTWRKGNR